MWPNTAWRPVSTTSAVAVPLTTAVPISARLAMSPAASPLAPSAANFSTGMDSPVSAAWFTNRSLAVSRRTSAGTRSPAARWMTSPGTSSAIGMSLVCACAPAAGRRRTAMTVCTIARSAAAALPERLSCHVASPTLNATMHVMTDAACQSRMRPDSAARQSSIRFNGLRSRPRRSGTKRCCCSVAIWLVPCSRLRACTSPSISPCSSEESAASACAPLPAATWASNGGTSLARVWMA